MSLEADLTNGASTIRDVVFDHTNNLVFVLNNQGEFDYYNSISYEHIASIDDVNDAIMLYEFENQLLVISGESHSYSVDFIEHPCTDCGDNSAPTATFSVVTAEPSTAGEVEFDASLSSDAEDATALKFRWDFDDDDIWDTSFSDDATATTSYPLKGNKTVRLQVKDAFGLVDEFSITFEVVQMPNYGVDVTDSVAYELETEIEDLYFDKSKNKLYISDRSAQKLFVVNMETGLTEKYFYLGIDAGAIAVTPDESSMYVALTAENSGSCCWWEDEQFGYVAKFDLSDLSWTETYEVAIDPYDMVATDGGNLVISSASGQWTEIKNFDAADGSELDSAFIRHRSKLSLHPDQDRVYAANTDLSPSDIEMFSITSNLITAEGDSPYHGDHRMGGNVWVTPDGDNLVTRGGDVFQATDMTYVTSLEFPYSWFTHLTFTDTTVTVATAHEGVFQFSLADYALLASDSTIESDFIFSYGGQIYYIEDSGQGIEIKQAALDQ